MKTIKENNVELTVRNGQTEVRWYSITKPDESLAITLQSEKDFLELCIVFSKARELYSKLKKQKDEEDSGK